MPLDGVWFCDDITQSKTVALLERGLSRVMVGYCYFPFYLPKRWYRSNPKYCMSGSLNMTDQGAWEPYYDFESLWVRQRAENYLLAETDGKSLVEFGTFGSRRRVIRAYQRAIKRAIVNLAPAPSSGRSMSYIADAQPGDIYVDETGKLWRVVGVDPEPTYHLRRDRAQARRAAPSAVRSGI